MAKEKKSQFLTTVNVRNKQAFFNYAIEDTLVAGMVLKGTEIKSIRMGKVNFTDGYCYISKGELYIKGMLINPYKLASFYNHEADRPRKLLLKKKEIAKIDRKINEKGFTIVPLRLFINDRGFAKIEIGVGKGKKLHDKRDTIKERDISRELKNF